MSTSLLERILLQRSGVILPRGLTTQARPAIRWYSSDADPSRGDAGSRTDFEDGSDRSIATSGLDTSRPKIERPIANEPLPEDDPISSYVSSPRTYRGVHRRDQRHKGQTPAERAAIDKSLKEIFDQLDPSGPDTFNLGPSSIFANPNPNQDQRFAQTDRSSSSSPGDATALRPWSRSVRRGYDREENDDMVEALDELKEEVSAISSDFELLDWAQRRVFDTLPKSDSPIEMETDDPTAFPNTYPRILAHLMKVSRQNFNNPHLSLSLFHQAQTHSPESYLSGCLSSAYTELIKTRWECFRDLEGVSRAILEMDANAVSWDRTTQSTIGKIVEQVGRDLIRDDNDDGGGGGGGRWGEGASEILFHLEKKVQRSLRTSEVLDLKAKRERERRLWS